MAYCASRRPGGLSTCIIWLVFPKDYDLSLVFDPFKKQTFEVDSIFRDGPMTDCTHQ